MKPAPGYRKYSHAEVLRIRFIKRAQTLGFSLDTIDDLLELDGPQICAVTHQLALNKLHLVEVKIAALRSIRDALQAMVRQCESKQHAQGVCPIIQSLATDETKKSRMNDAVILRKRLVNQQYSWRQSLRTDDLRTDDEKWLLYCPVLL